MPVTGEMQLAGQETKGEAGIFNAVSASSGQALEPKFRGASQRQLEAACEAADADSAAFAQSSPWVRAGLLEAIGAKIEGIGDELIERCMAESGLPRGRLEGERARTINQLSAFAAMLRDGRLGTTRIDKANPDRKPAPKPDLRLVHIGLGPVAVFSASNFPLAFSVAGGDTAAALAAGCPVIVKAHSAHPGTSELVGRAIRQAVEEAGLPGGIFSMLFDDGLSIGQALVADRRIQAVGFTGSRKGGLALMEIAGRRPQPIPVYAEMSAINPVILLPHRLEAEAEAVGAAFAAALTLGAGQFCTNPGLVIGIASEALDRFIDAVAHAIKAAPAAPMLTPGILEAYNAGTKRLGAVDGVAQQASGQHAPNCGASALFATDAATFLSHDSLQEEVFGASSLVVRCDTLEEVEDVLSKMEGQLTVAIHMAPEDYPAARHLMPIIERKAGRIISNGFGTGVEVSPAMVHGGPFPATSDGRSTSVGTLAVERFLRPVCYQDIPDELLPAQAKESNPWLISRQLLC
ncbi:MULTISPECIES: aldehyde dehydrogenase (NADP(+)) [unclassified Sphingobium]|uniref:aldehyde dehydrogenase (NADP(+)) n=1 Tax=unclassified Sphingobium TaxID=2611147 RepID=UPI002224002F|nr:MULTISPECIES: aldehyde dehydrogenase (NADP(+)) [unclassified Sphingobium]MCW2395743.1 NADP-dependent aldehyde dehydrogenase [Sphingobium sp. B8D3B]MCW2419258.1 NADP-dependent aldehyde dehydrogenase [Sphingobium sp. B8D3C]